jgi:hypothetical protein
MMGADGLKEKIKRNIDGKKVGFTEMFSRYGNKYLRITPEVAAELKSFRASTASMLIKANFGKDIDVQRIIAKTGGSLRNIYNEYQKQMAGTRQAELVVEALVYNNKIKRL